MRDSQKSKVYDAEHTLNYMLDRAGTSAQTIISGVPVQLEPEDRFTHLVGIQAYVNRVVLHPEVLAEFGHRGTVTVRERKGENFAHYQYGLREIAINTSKTGWAMREVVVLHELAHHFARGCGHGTGFIRAHQRLIEIVIGPQTALAMRLLHAESGCK